MADIVDRKKLAIHESCHAVLTRLFSGYLILSDVYIDPTGASGKFGSNTVQSTSNVVLNTYSAMGIVWPAGVIGDTIDRDGIEGILSQKRAILENRKLLDWMLGGEDEPNFEYNATFVSTNYDCDFKKYQQFCLSYAIDFLAEKAVWEYVQQLAATFLARPDLKLTASELDDFFQNSGFDQYLTHRKAELIERLDKMKDECQKDDPWTNYDFTPYPLP